MKVLNPTGWDIECGYNGKKFVFAPHEEKEIYDINVIVHLCRSAGHKGLVHLVYNDEQQQKYDSFKVFKKHQVVEGLRNLKKHCVSALMYEKQAMRDLQKTGGSEFDKLTMNPDKFENRIKEVDKWIAAAESVGEDGSTDNKRQSKTKA